MHSKVKACTECTRTCWLLHKGNNSVPASSAASFFKVMFGEEFSTFLFLPPKFVNELSLMAGKIAILEDSCGEQWDVRVSRVEGSLAFQQGWSKFALDHDLKMGDFVLFLHITETHLVVKIYDSTSCEKLKFPERRSNLIKRKRDSTTTSSGRSGPRGTADGNSIDTSVNFGVAARNGRCPNDVIDVVKEPIVTQNKSIWNYKNEISGAAHNAEYAEETYCIMNREKQEDDIRCNLDLSVLETLNNVGSKRNNKESLTAAERFPKPFDSSMRSQKGACLTSKDQVVKEVSSGAGPLHSFNCEKKGSFSFRDYTNIKTSGNPLPMPVVNPVGNGRNTLNMSNRGIEECQVATAAGNNQVSQSKKHNAINEHPQTARYHIQGTSVTSSKMTKIVKEEFMEIESDQPFQKLARTSSQVTNAVHSQSVNFGVKKDDRDSVLKTVNVDVVGGSTVLPNFSPFLATSSKSFIELPEFLPFPYVKGRYGSERKLVFLRDSSQKLWPVVYHENLNVQFITNGWEAFCKANGIQSGDQCLFKIENESEGIYSVSGVRQ
ncbi:uncharacterized protein LOC133830142 [Humulus lupulus]|uniref:uncharacterized protein LOC133830142 n=1 Tax=Humulus lupulus TaxID=3486 RepID=UPI002B4131D4|nr:uncharacterized protein LOC133830142 [Humulus lupulus]